MRVRKWLRGCKLRQLKKWYKSKIPNSGFYYSPKEYDKLITYFESLKVGDIVFNPCKLIEESIKEINSYWEEQYRGFRLLRYEIITESGCIIYNPIETPPPEVIAVMKKVMEDFNRS